MYTIKLTMDEAIRLSARLERAAEEDRSLAEELEIPECRDYFRKNADFFKSLAQRLDRAIGIGGV